MPETMQCPICKNVIPSGLTFCSNCGTNLLKDSSTGKKPGQTKDKQPAEESKNWLWVIGVIGLCLACLMLVTSVYTIAIWAGVDLPNPLANKATLNQERVIEIVWQALDPNTHSHTQTAWEVNTIQIVTGQEVQDQFTGDPARGCLGPTPPDNTLIVPDGRYYYVEIQPIPAMPQPVPDGQYSPTAPPNIPEPFVQKAQFLIDAITGEVTARKLFCVIY